MEKKRKNEKDDCEFEEVHQLLLDRHLALRTQEGELKSGYF